MKKSLIALAALAAAGAASAESSVTLFGVVDATYTNSRASQAGSVSVLRSDGYNSSRLGFRGTEDLGGGMSASFWLEAGFNADSGIGSNSTASNNANGDRIAFNSTPATLGTTYFPQSSLGARQGLTFNRRSTVSLAGGWGELRLGRDYVPTFWNMTVFDPFGTNGVGSSLNTILGFLNPRAVSAFPPGAAAPQVRSSNSIGYFLPANLGGFYGQVMYAFSEQPSQCTNAGFNSTGGSNQCAAGDNDGRYVGGRIGWAAGPINVAASYARTSYNDNGVAAFAAGIAGVGNGSTYNGDYTQWTLAGQYDFGVGKLMAQYGEQNVDAIPAIAANAALGVAAAAAVPERTLKHWLIGGLIPVGAGEVRLSYQAGKREDGAGSTADGNKVRQWSIGYVHNLSKRTAVYTTYANQRATGVGVTASVMGLASVTTGAAGGSVKSTGLDIGLRHSF